MLNDAPYTWLRKSKHYFFLQMYHTLTVLDLHRELFVDIFCKNVKIYNYGTLAVCW
jgi:hypothetical protein